MNKKDGPEGETFALDPIEYYTRSGLAALALQKLCLQHYNIHCRKDMRIHDGGCVLKPD